MMNKWKKRSIINLENKLKCKYRYSNRFSAFNLIIGEYFERFDDLFLQCARKWLVHFGFGVKLYGHLQPGFGQCAVKIFGQLLQPCARFIQTFRVGHFMFGSFRQYRRQILTKLITQTHVLFQLLESIRSLQNRTFSSIVCLSFSFFFIYFFRLYYPKTVLKFSVFDHNFFIFVSI